MRAAVKHGSSASYALPLSLSSSSVRLASFAGLAVAAAPRPSGSSSIVTAGPSRIHRRNQSSSSSRWAISSFFSRRPPSPSPSASAIEDPTSALRESVAGKDVDALRRAYDALQTSSFPPSPEDLQTALVLLSSPAIIRSPGAFHLFKRIYDDLDPRWGVELTAKHHRLLVSALLGIGRPLLAASAAHDHNLVDAKLWRDILKSTIAISSSQVDEIWALLSSHIPVGPSEYTLLLSHLHINLSDTSQIRERLTGILRDLRERGEWIGVMGEVELAYVQLKLGDLPKAESLVEGWELDKSDTYSMWNVAAEVEMAKVLSGAVGGMEGVEDVIRRMQLRKIKPVQRVLTFLVLQELRRLVAGKSAVGLPDVLRAVDKVEGICKVRAGSAVWGEIIYFLSHATPSPGYGQLSLPLEVYHEAKSRGVEITSSIARNLIRPLCLLDPPDLLRSMAIYADWSASPLQLGTARDRERALDVYIPLLKACANTPGAGGTVIRLLSDLRSRGLPLPSGAAVSLAISLMRQAPDHGAAFNIYAHFYALNSAALTTRDYEALLAAFLSLRSPSSAFAPPHLYLEIVKDMKRAGHPPSSHVISSLLQSYAIQATKTRQSSSDPDVVSTRLRGLEKSVAELHTVLKLDPLVEVDVPLLSSLMDAYNRLGAWGSAFDVWADLVERLPREHPARVKELYGPAISVVLDTCGRSDQLGRARRIWAWTERHGLRNGKHVETWVEALCRLDHMDEALRLVLEMKGEVTVEMLEVLARFSMSDGGPRGKGVREALGEQFPRKWAEVKRRIGRRGGSGESRESEGDTSVGS